MSSLRTNVPFPIAIATGLRKPPVPANPAQQQIQALQELVKKMGESHKAKDQTIARLSQQLKAYMAKYGQL